MSQLESAPRTSFLPGEETAWQLSFLRDHNPSPPIKGHLIVDNCYKEWSHHSKMPKNHMVCVSSHSEIYTHHSLWKNSMRDSTHLPGRETSAQVRVLASLPINGDLLVVSSWLLPSGDVPLPCVYHEPDGLTEHA